MIVAPPEHVLLEFDLSQAETWVVAYLANEVNMKYSLSFGDIHTDTAAGVYNKPKSDITKVERYLGKKGNHSLSYRSSIGMLVISINAESDKPPYTTVSYKEGKFIYDGWHSLYNLHSWWSELELTLEKNNRTLVTPYNRKRTFFQHWGSELFKEATAYIPQSTVADHLNGAVHQDLNIEGGLLTVYKRLSKKSLINVINQSHDSFVCECPESNYLDISKEIYSYIYRPIIVNGEQFTIPVDCKVGHRLGELEKLKVA